MAAVAQAGERGGEARVLVRLEEERDAVGRRLVTLLVADSAGASLSLEEIERRDGQRGLGIVRDLVRRWGGHLVVRPERPPLGRRLAPRSPGPRIRRRRRVGSRRARATGGGRHDMSRAPCFVVCEDGQEYTDRFTRMLGGSFRFVRAGCFAEAKTALAAGPVAALLLDLDFRRTPPDQLVDEAGRPGLGGGWGSASGWRPCRGCWCCAPCGPRAWRRRPCCSPTWTRRPGGPPGGRWRRSRCCPPASAWTSSPAAWGTGQPRSALECVPWPSRLTG